jgi:hypothetical protein
MPSSAPDWPGLMRRETAARYCDMKVSEFEGEVTSGRLPNPIMIGRGERWNRRQLDEALDRLSGTTTPDWRSGSNLYA